MHPVLESDGVASAAQLRSMRNRLPGLVASGELLRPFPGVYVVPARSHETAVKLRAVQLSLPSAVFIGKAMRAYLDPSESVDDIDVAVTAWGQARPRVRQHRIDVPEVVEIHGLRFAPAAWNALWTAAWDAGEGIDHFLRRGGSLAELHGASAHFRGTRGSAARRRILSETRADTWSSGERALHRLLRSQDLPEWQANRRIRTSAGNGFVVDVVFRAARVVIEFDGWAYHGGREAFENDRARQAELVADGWAVLRFTWRQVQERPQWVLSCVRGAVAAGAMRLAA